MQVTTKKIKDASEKLNWNLTETEAAISELLKTESITNLTEVIAICLKHSDKERRWNELLTYLLEYEYNDLTNVISTQLQNPDPCFDVFVTFNTTDEDSAASKLYELHGKKSFLIRDMYFGLYNPLIQYKTRKNDAMYDSYHLCYEFLDHLVNKRNNEGADIHLLLVELLSVVGFSAFQIDAFKDLAASYSSGLANKDKASSLSKAISEHLKNKENTQKQYWLTYVSVERAREKYGLRGSFKKIAEVTNEKFNTIQPRYFDRKKIATNEDLKINEIITKYSLQQPLLEIEQKFKELEDKDD